MSESESFRSLTESMLPGSGPDLFIQIRDTESDRGAALLGCSMVESALKRQIQSISPHLSEKERNDLFGGRGIFGSFGAMIEASYVFQTITPEVRSDLNVIRSVRNAFGHSPRILDFEHPRIIEKLSVLKAKKDLSGLRSSTRGIFVYSVMTNFIALAKATIGHSLHIDS